MPMRVKAAAAAKAVLPRISPELLDQIVTGPMTQQGIEEVMQSFKKALIERALGAEMSHHLGYAPGGVKPSDATNQRNGTSGKTVLTGEEALRIDIPRDRLGSFEPQLIGKHERRFTGFDDKIIAMYARGMTVREIQAFLSEMYAVDVSPDLISSVTDAVMSEVGMWQSRPLEQMYPVVSLMATPNCSTYGQSNCSRQDAGIMAIQWWWRCVMRPPSVGNFCPRTPTWSIGA